MVPKNGDNGSGNGNEKHAQKKRDLECMGGKIPFPHAPQGKEIFLLVRE